MNLKSDPRIVLSSLNRFIDWLNRNGFATYDPYDLMTTGYAGFARKIYYFNALLGLPFVFPILFADLFFPGIRKMFIQKKRFAIVEAHLSIGFSNLYRYTNKIEYLDKAISLCEHLDELKIEGFHGPCWGYPFNWRSSSGFWRAGTPFITVTPYCFEACLELFELTNNKHHLEYALSIASFAFHDLNETRHESDSLSNSYSPLDHSRVINATAYRSFILLSASRFNKDDLYRQKAIDGIHFVSENQNADGSWLYAANDVHNTFIDNFHTCFVLKNLIKCNSWLKSDKLTDTISRGLDFYLHAFIRPDFSLKPFIKSNKFKIVKENLYDYAEAINLAILSKPYNAEFDKVLENLIAEVSCWQMKNGSYINQKNIFGIKTRQSYLRWGIAPLFDSLTQYLRSTS
ncbi:MAG: hypothetical protein WCO44_04260 [Bacteroidota bacterium]